MPSEQDRTQWLPSDWIRNGWERGQAYYPDPKLHNEDLSNPAVRDSIEGCCFLGAEQLAFTCNAQVGILERKAFSQALQKLCLGAFGEGSISISNDDYIDSATEALAFVLAAEEMAGLR